MAWSRFEPGFTRHPKRLKGGPLASWLWVCSVDHCSIYRTDGWLEAASVPSLVPGLSPRALTTAVTVLLAVGSWEEAPGGYRVHGYLEHNPSKAQTEAERDASRQRYQRWRAGANAVGSGASNGVANALQTDLSVSQSVSSKESKTKSKTLSGTPDAVALLAFLNHKAGRNFQPSAVNLDFIRARLKDGASVDHCRAIIGRKTAEWKGDPKTAVWLRPATLFNRTKFAQYLGELPATAFQEAADDRVSELREDQ
jgi:uncharacterized phage protein (TIGR02220 family)